MALGHGLPEHLFGFVEKCAVGEGDRDGRCRASRLRSPSSMPVPGFGIKSNPMHPGQVRTGSPISCTSVPDSCIGLAPFDSPTVPREWGSWAHFLPGGKN